MDTVVKDFIKKHQLLKKNATVLVGVSGGPDSMALLHLLASIKEQWNLRLIALTVDHQLRGAQSKADVQYVEQICMQWGIQVEVASLDVRSYEREHRVSTQVAARDVRYQFFSEQMSRFGAQYLALGHHGDDQVETMFMTMTRSASSQALLGIPMKRSFGPGFIIRPLLSVSKAQIGTYCGKHNIQPRLDPSNENIADTRVYFRKKIIPIIKEKNDNIHTTIQHLSESLHEDESFLQKEANQMIDDVVQYKQKDKRASFQIDKFKSYAHALQRRAFHLLLNYLYDGRLPKGLSYVHESDFFTLIAQPHGTVQLDFPDELIVERSYGTVSFSFQQKKLRNEFQKTVLIPGTTVLPDGSKLSAQIVSEQERIKTDKYTYFCAKEAITFPLYIRTRQAGDRMSWGGLKGSKKLKDIFIDEKVPRSKRSTWPIIVDHEGEILWLIGLKKGEPARTVKSTTWIQLYFEKGNKQE